MAGSGEGDMPDSVTLRRDPLDRYVRLIPIPIGARYLLTTPPGELLWFVGGVIVILGILLGVVVWSERMVMTRDVLMQKRRLLVDRTYPTNELTVHEHQDRVEVRHNGGRLLLRFLRAGRVSMRHRHHVPALPWDVAVETMHTFLEDAKNASEAPPRRRST